MKETDKQFCIFSEEIKEEEVFPMSPEILKEFKGKMNKEFNEKSVCFLLYYSFTTTLILKLHIQFTFAVFALLMSFFYAEQQMKLENNGGRYVLFGSTNTGKNFL